MHNTKILVDSPELLNNLVDEIAKLKDCDCLSLDTEFMRNTTYFPSLELIQICIGGTAYLVDVSKADILPLLEVLNHTQASVLIFSAREDLEILFIESQKLSLDISLPENIVDLQIMMAFLNLGYSVGLQQALRDYADIDLPKDQTLSDWSARPFTKEQLSYAADDVLYLHTLYSVLLSKFEKDDKRLNWFYEEMKLFSANAQTVVEPEQAYLNVSGAGNLNKKELTVLKNLCKRRMEFAILNDESLNRIITNKSLCSIARLTRATPQSLAKCNMKWGAIRENGNRVIEWFNEGRLMKVDENIILPYDYFVCSSFDISNKAKDLKKKLKDRANNLNIAPELISSKALINNAFYSSYYGEEPLLKQSWYKSASEGIEIFTA